MQTKQYSVKVFEVNITDEEEFIAFFDKNYLFFTKHLISISGIINQEIEDYLKEKNLTYIINIELPRAPKKQPSKVLPQEGTEDPKQEQKKDEEKKEPIRVEDHLKVIDKLVRSGQELKIKGDLLLLNRVNSGGTIDIDGNLIVTQLVEGSIRCRGNFMMLKASLKANIVFHGVEVDNSYLQERLNRVELKENKIEITPVLKETSWV